MSSIAKKIAMGHHNQTGELTTRSLAHGFRAFMPKGLQKAKRLARRLADVKEERLAWKEAKEG